MIDLLRTVRTALMAIRRNSLRAFLTALGIIIGIAAVIVMMEIGQGSRAAIQQTIAGMGSNTILITPGTAASGGVSFGAGSSPTLTEADADAIRRESPSVRSVAPVVRARAQVVYGNRNWVPQNIYGTTADYLDVRDWTKLAQGSVFTERDVRNRSKVCLIGQTLVRELFQGEDPIGKEIRVQNVSLKVVGVLARKGANMMGMDQDDIVLAPWTTVKNRIAGNSSSSSSSSPAVAQTPSSTSLYPSGEVKFYPPSQDSQTLLNRRISNIDQIQISARSAESVKSAIQEMSELLRERHRLRATDPDDFTVRDMTELAAAFSSTTALMTKLLLCVALISLVVGGIGIMNIMLVSVTERTREIGLRLAVGAREQDILRQFLIEAVVLCFSGGILGIILGRGVSLMVQGVLGWPTESSLPAVVAAFLVSVSVGLVFGYYPAAKAARLDPIEALRRE
ncbi:MAG: ABC transporter permease [Deltaproteobacteria bacterium]|nr:ABC transporter permease [Deltaproteobacteria bacterium]